MGQQSYQDPAADSMAMTLCCLGWWLFPPLLFCAACSCNHKSKGARCWGRMALAGLLAWVVLIILIVITIGAAVSSVGSLTRPQRPTAGAKPPAVRAAGPFQTVAGAAAAMIIGGAATSVPPEALLEPLARPLDVALVATGTTGAAADLLTGGIEYMTSKK